ncbi:non-specific phospholipase C4-like isoform X2 [Camellia sinensis]|nr:non-specific phospholipase C4-like isoform X2 [Camellia sinensis]
MASETPNPPFPIKTVVVLVQENRSFDHMLGWMKSLNPQINGVTGSESNPLSTSDPGSNRLFFGQNSIYVDSDPGHSIQAMYEQIFGQPWTQNSASQNLQPTMQGFAQNAERTQKGMSETVMNGFKPESVAVYKELVAEYAVCDRWFAAVPASTQPNRLFVHSATSHGATSNDTKKLIEGFPQKTIFESLDEEGHSFGIYYQAPPATLFYRNLRKLKYVKNFHGFDLHFKRHCKEGKLPNYVVVEQRYFDLKILPGNDDHPSHDVFEGQKFVKEVYEALRSSPQWNEMLFIIIYDEHGGFYDHVPTPMTGVPSPDGLVGSAPYNFQFDRLGVRVPAIMISPWIERGTVKLPEPVKLREAEAKENAKLTEFQEEMVQMAATLCGDHKKDIYPDKLVENMTVDEAVKYVNNSFKKFLEECEKAKASGADESQICVPNDDDPPKPPEYKSKSFASKFFSCVACAKS